MLPRMMLTFPDPSIRQRLMDELLTEDGRLDWERLEQYGRPGRPRRRLSPEDGGLAEPALDMLLSPEGAALRQALVMPTCWTIPSQLQMRVEDLAPLCRRTAPCPGGPSSTSWSPFFCRQEGEETRAQLAAGLRANGNGSLDLAAVMDWRAWPGKLHPEFRTSTLISALGGYLLSEEGKPARNQIVTASAQWVLGGIAGALGGLAHDHAASGPNAGADGERTAPIDRTRSRKQNQKLWVFADATGLQVAQLRLGLPSDCQRTGPTRLREASIQRCARSGALSVVRSDSSGSA